MRQVTQELFSKIIIRRYMLPDANCAINQTSISTLPDHCLDCNNCELLSDLIGYSLIDYCFDEEEQSNKDVKTLLKIALNMRVKVRLEADMEFKLLQQGFFGESLLYSILLSYFGADTLICRGHLFNPSAKGETPGDDAFHMLGTDDEINLCFGEAKFYDDYNAAIESVIKSMKRSLSTEYLRTNLMTVLNHHEHIRNAKMATILNDWKESGFVITLDDLMHKKNIKLVYPALIIYDDRGLEYEEIIKRAIKKINKEVKNHDINVPEFCSVFFILLPISDAKKIKLDAIKWINTKQN